MRTTGVTARLERTTPETASDWNFRRLEFLLEDIMLKYVIATALLASAVIGQTALTIAVTSPQTATTVAGISVGETIDISMLAQTAATRTPVANLPAEFFPMQ